MERVILLPGHARLARPVDSPAPRPRVRRHKLSLPGRAADLSLRDSVAVVLGGGQGKRLFPLTRDRAKPAVPIGGKYRLVDVSISNCLNSGLDRIFVLTQFRSASLHRHVAQTYRFDAFSKGFVEILAAEQTESSSDWYQGTADAVRKQWERIRSERPRDVVILSGDHLYRMDVRQFVSRHREKRADLTIAVTPVPRTTAPSLGLVRVDRDDMIVEFAEKPEEPTVLDRFALDRPREDATHLASMGVYVFRAAVLEEILAQKGGIDFGRHLIPEAIRDRPVAAHRFSGYWEDLGTIASYHRANLHLTEAAPSYDFFVPEDPLYTVPAFLPPSRIDRATLDRALLSEGCILGEGARVSRSVLGPRSVLGKGSSVLDSVVMGSTTWERPPRGPVPLGIGERCFIAGAVLDRDVRIGNDVVLENRAGHAHLDQDGILYVRDGIIVVPRGTTIPDGFVF